MDQDIRKLHPPVRPTVRKRDNSSPFVTDSSTQEALPSTATAVTGSKSNRKKRPNSYGSTNSSQAVYWSEFETQEEEPYTVPVTDASPLIPWLRHNRDLERAQDRKESGFIKRVWDKLARAVKLEVKTSVDGLSRLFYEKVGYVSTSTDDESEDSSDEPLNRRNVGGPVISRTELLNRGYILCVLGCITLSSFFGIIAFLLRGSASGTAVVLIGFLFSITIELVCLVRFVMYLHSWLFY